MIGIIVELIASWLLLRFVYKQNLSELHFKPTNLRNMYLVVGAVLAAGCCLVYHLMMTAFAHNSWVLNPKMAPQTIAASGWWVFQSVLFEELLFRGALLYIAIKKFGAHKACLFSAICFGIAHWFAYNAWNNPFQLLIVFSMTGLAGWVLALAFAKTHSLYLPLGLHFGWNFINIVIFSNGPLGQQLLIKANPNRPDGITSLLVFLFQVFAMPLLACWYIKRLPGRKMGQQAAED